MRRVADDDELAPLVTEEEHRAWAGVERERRRRQEGLRLAVVLAAFAAVIALAVALTYLLE